LLLPAIVSTDAVTATAAAIAIRTATATTTATAVQDDAMDASRLQELGVTHVLNVAAQAPPLHADKFVYLKVTAVHIHIQQIE
jgi:hypothetical protein